MGEKQFKRYTVTTALPYVNGPLHIGHLAGVYVPADIYVRYLRSKGVDVLFIGGSDEHGVPITIKAQQEGVSPKDITDKYHNIIKSSFKEFGISFDVYSRTSLPIHHETASEFFKILHNKGELIEKETEQYYDDELKQFLADRYITGTCPHCNYDEAYGDQCEKCGTSLSPTELIKPKSTLSGNKPVLKKTKHWFLSLDKYSKWLEQWILEDHKEWKINVSGQCKSWIFQGLKPRAVTRDLNWGVKVPLPDTEGKVLYVWFDAPIGYISAAKEWARENNTDWEKYWKSDDTRLIHFIGKDNIVFHCIIFPAMLKAEGSYILPDNVPANEFLNLEGNKISTSQNWAVWLHEFLEEFKDMQDVLRYVLCSVTPETKDSDFTWKDFQAKNNNELLAILGNFINRTVVLLNTYYEGIIPDVEKLSQNAENTFTEINNLKAKIEDSLEKFRFREALSYYMDIARLGNKYLTENEPWKKQATDPEFVKEILFVSVQIVAKLAIYGEPFLIFTSEKIFNMLNIKKIKWNENQTDIIIYAHHKINKPTYLFTRIEDEIIQQQIEKLERNRMQNIEKNKTSYSPSKEAISYDSFSTMDIRVATILEARKVPKTKKLLEIVVDTGIDKRTIVAGIAEFHEPESITGKQVLVLVNLAPRDIKGIKSEGMILLAEDATGKLTFVVPETKTDNGSVVK